MNEAVELPPPFLQLAGHPLRWSLLRALARGDFLVDELAQRVAHPQNLVSYHLGKLRAAEMVTARRSSRDGREVFYRLNIARCGELLASAGRALHPGIREACEPAAGCSLDGAAPPRVLFLCTQNIARSQIAEAFLRAQSGDRIPVASAGSRPGAIHPNTVRILAARGLDVGEQRSKHVYSLLAQRFDLVVTVCDHMREQCPEFPGAPERMHWSIPDPAANSDADASWPLFEEVAGQIEERVMYLLRAISASTPGGRGRMPATN